MRWIAIAIAVATSAGCGPTASSRASWQSYPVIGCGLDVAMPGEPLRSNRAIALRVDRATRLRAYCAPAAGRPVSSSHDVASAALGPLLNELFRRGYEIADAQRLEVDGVPGVAIVLTSPDRAAARLLGAYLWRGKLLVLDAVADADDRETLTQFSKSLRIQEPRRTVAVPVRLLGEL